MVADHPPHARSKRRASMSLSPQSCSQRLYVFGLCMVERFLVLVSDFDNQILS